MSPRENADTKARRYLSEGRIIIDRVDPDTVRAIVRGDAYVHRVQWNRSAGWWCSCPARGRCSHLLAVGMVVAVGGSSSYHATRTRSTAPGPQQARRALEAALSRTTDAVR